MARTPRRPSGRAIGYWSWVRLGSGDAFREFMTSEIDPKNATDHFNLDLIDFQLNDIGLIWTSAKEGETQSE